MEKRKVKQTDAVQAAQSQPADAEAKVVADPDPDQSRLPENKAPDNTEQQSQPPENGIQDNSETQQSQQADVEKPPMFMIICRNKINKTIGGVSFVDGVGYTSDGFTASWFGNKEGYEVRNSGL